MINIKETELRKSKKLKHLITVPMFTIYVDTELPQENILHLQNHIDDIKDQFQIARNEIHRLGFPSMHLHVIISDLSDVVNMNTGQKGIGGCAVPGLKYIRLNTTCIYASTIVHEWAHIWMMNNSKPFKKAVEIFYNHLSKAIYLIFSKI